MRDLSERDEIRGNHADRPGTGHHIERLMGERENAEAYGQDERVGQIDEQLARFGHSPASVRAARKAAAENAAAEQKAAGGGEAKAARQQAPAERTAPPDRQSTTAKPGT